MTWAERTITDAGLILLQEALDGKAFTVVSAAAGTGYKEPSQLASQIAIEEQISGLDCKIVENNELSSGPGREIVVQITNSGITEATRIKQVGIYAKTDGAPVLFAVVQDSDGCIVPAEGYIGGYKLRLKFGVPISATEKITVITTPEGTASKEDLADSIQAHDTDQNAHATLFNEIRKEIEQLNPPGITSQDIIIPTSGWENSKDAEISGLSVDVPIEGVTEAMIPIVAISPTYDATTKACGLNIRTKTVDGSVRFYAQTAPEQPITVLLTLLSPSGNTASGKLQPATKDRIGGVIIGDGVAVTAEGKISVATEDISATDADADNIINSIFGN